MEKYGSLLKHKKQSYSIWCSNHITRICPRQVQLVCNRDISKGTLWHSLITSGKILHQHSCLSISKDIVVFIHNGVLFIGKDWRFAICSKLGWSREHHDKRNKQEDKRQVSHTFFHLWKIKGKNKKDCLKVENLWGTWKNLETIGQYKQGI